MKRDGTGNPGPSTARKTRHQTQDHNKTRQEDRQRKAKSKGNRADETGQSDSQETRNRRAKHQKKRSQETKTKGGESVKHRLATRKGENHKGGDWGGREKLPTNHTVPRKGEALTVLGQSTARKVRYLQVPGGRLDRC